MKLDKIAAAEKLVDDVLKKAEADAAEIKKQISEMEEAKRDAVKKQERALNGKAIMEAKYNEIAAEKSIESLSKKLDELAKRPLISETEYNTEISSVRKEFDALTLETMKKLAGLAEEMDRIAHEFEGDLSRANNVLHRLQNDVYKNADDDYVRDTEGLIMYGFKSVLDEETGAMKIIPGDPTVVHTEQHIDRTNIVNWGSCAVRNYTYQQFKANH